MAIEITEFADVSISVSPTGVSGGNFGILGFLTPSTDPHNSQIMPAERARPYTSLASVAADWPTNSETYKAAQAYYSQTPTPTDFTVLMNYATAVPAALVGGGSDSVADLVANITGSGVLDMTIEGTSIAISSLDLSSATDEDSVATLLGAALNAELDGAYATWNGYQYVVTGPTAGVSATITFATGDAATALGLTQASAKISNGIDAETAVESLAVVASMGVDYVGLVTHQMWRDNQADADNSGNAALDIANAAEGYKKIFCNTTNDRTHLVVGSTNVASKCKAATLRYTLTTFSNDATLYPSASVFGRAASVNFNQIGSTITLNLKTMPGITAEDLTPSEFAALRSYNASAVVQIGSSTNAYTDSRMASGSWLDTTHGLLWLENRIETDAFNLLYVNNRKVPFTQAGLNSAKATLERSLRAAIRNGLSAPGFLPDGTFLPEGFVVEAVALADVPAGDKGNRLYQGLSFKMIGAGALHELLISGEFAE